jgi:hypothetical protein
VETKTDPSARDAAAGSAAEAGPRALLGRPAFAETPAFPGATLALGIFLVMLGVTGALAAFRSVPVSDTWFRAPRLLVGLVGAGAFGPLGLALGVHGGREISRRRRAARERLLAPEAPWRWDRAWSKDGEHVPRRGQARRAVAVAILAWMILGAAVAVAFMTDAPVAVRAGVLALSATGLAPLWHAASCVRGAWRHGRTFVRWSPFPAFVGERITLRLGVSRRTPKFSRLTVRMRCVQERVVETDDSGRPCQAEIVAFEMFEAVRTIVAAEDLPQPGVEAVLPFEIPADLPGNDLASDLPTYWELDVHGEGPSTDHRVQFLLPIYARS